ncbi:hypothetical protein ACQPUY_15825 [Clostridium nigeriense]|uniref:hypothetical protein n=1 Tax=Clostridium nigeriense TaxID=1805470 RepID=UPI003D348786
MKINKAIDEVSATVSEDIEIDSIREVKDIINRSCNKKISAKCHKQLNFNNFTGRRADYYGNPDL